MNKISCDVCADLMPLVKDGIASEDSRALVNEHLCCCESCSRAYGIEIEAAAEWNDTAVLARIKKQMGISLLIVMIAGALFGMAIAGGSNLFYNALIMPAIGALGYVLLRKKSYLAVGGLFLFSFLWVAVREIVGGFLGYGTAGQLIAMSAWWAVIFAAFSALGVLIAGLLHYAFKKE